MAFDRKCELELRREGRFYYKLELLYRRKFPEVKVYLKKLYGGENELMWKMW